MDLTPEDRERIYQEERARREHPPEGSGNGKGVKISRKRVFKGIVWGLLGLIFILLVCVSNLTRNDTKQNAPPLQGSRSQAGVRNEGGSRPQLSGENKRYATWAFNYLHNTESADLELAKTMAGLNSGETVLDDVRREIGVAKDTEMIAYVDHPDPPGPFGNIDTQFARVHRLHDAAFREMLAYWKDGSIDHVESGTLTFNRAATAMHDAQGGLSAACEAAIAQ